jgi:serine/threonine-protein kinase
LSSAVSQFEQTNSSPWVVAFWKARAQRLRGLREFVLGRDPRVALETAVEVIRAAAGESPKDFWLLEELAMCRLLEAMHEQRVGLDPVPALEQARAAAQRARELSASTSQSILLLSANIELAAIRAAARPEDVREERFKVAFGYLSTLLSHPGSDSVPYQVAAELHAERAAWLTKRGRSSEEDIRSGLARVEEALSRNPHNPEALLAKERLHLERARMTRTR